MDPNFMRIFMNNPGASGGARRSINGGFQNQTRAEMIEVHYSQLQNFIKLETSKSESMIATTFAVGSNSDTRNDPSLKQTVATLRPITLKECRVNEVEKARVLLLRTLVPPARWTSVTLIAEDLNGDTERIALYDWAPPSANTHKRLAELLPVHTVLAIKSPWYKDAADGLRVVRCEQAANVEILPLNHPLLAGTPWGSGNSTSTSSSTGNSSTNSSASSGPSRSDTSTGSTTSSNRRKQSNPLSSSTTTTTTTTTSSSSSPTADTLRTQGNDFFKSKEYSRALHFYIESFAASNYTDIRSASNAAEACLLLSHWQHALEWAEKALLIDTMDQKARMRKCRALIGLRRYLDALSAQGLRHPTLRHANDQSIKNEIARAEKGAQESCGVYNWHQLATFAHEHPDSELPILEEFQHKSLTIKPVPGKGMGVVATSPIPANTLVIVSKPAVIVWESECKAVDYAHFPSNLKIEHAPRISKNILVQKVRNILSSPSTTTATTTTTTTTSKLPSTPASSISPATTTTTSSASSSTSLSTPSTSTDMDLARSLRALSIVGFRPTSLPKEQQQKQHQQATSDTNLALAIVAANSFSVSSMLDIVEKVYDPTSSRNKGGTGIWLFPSRFNHSCLSNCAYSHLGDLLVIQTTEPIRAGEELTLRYLPVVAKLGSAMQRWKELQQRWGFQCSCKLCIDENFILKMLEKKEKRRQVTATTTKTTSTKTRMTTTSSSSSSSSSTSYTSRDHILEEDPENDGEEFEEGDGGATTTSLYDWMPDGVRDDMESRMEELDLSVAGCLIHLTNQVDAALESTPFSAAGGAAVLTQANYPLVTASTYFQRLGHMRKALRCYSKWFDYAWNVPGSQEVLHASFSVVALNAIVLCTITERSEEEKQKWKVRLRNAHEIAYPPGVFDAKYTPITEMFETALGKKLGVV